MIYFIGDFGYFGCDINEHTLINNITKLKQHMIENNTTNENNVDEETMLLLGGDNFYPMGIEHDKDIKLKLFGNYFNFLNKHQIHGVLGNHDYGGYINYQLNNNYFNCKKNLYVINKGTIDLFMIDTTVIDYNTYTPVVKVYENIFPKEHNLFHKTHEFNKKNDKKYNAFNELQKFKKRMLMDLFNNRRTMLKELDNSLHKSYKNGKTIVLVGHYPLQSYGSYYSHNDNNTIFKHLVPLILKYNINYYICGHEHNNQHLYYSSNDLENIHNNIQNKLITDDVDFIDKTMEIYNKNKLESQSNKGYIGVKNKNPDGLHIFICGSFVETYYGYFSNMLEIHHLHDKHYVVNFDASRKAYLKITPSKKSILISFIDTETNKYFYSVCHHF